MSSSGVLEAMACAEYLCLSQDLGVVNIVVSSDCLEVINMLKTRNFRRYSVILKEIELRH
jgi:hypothetical protein